MKNIAALVSLAVVAFSANAETPASVDRPKLTKDETWTYQKRDLTTNEVVGQQTVTIVGETAEGYLVDVKQTQGYSFTPPEGFSLDLGWTKKINDEPTDTKWLSFPLTPGKTWKSHDLWKSATGALGYDDLTYTIVGSDAVTVPAGTFQATKIHGEGWWNLSGQYLGSGRAIGGGSADVTVWYAPEVKGIVRYERKTINPRSVTHFAFELTASKLNKEATAAQK